MKFISTTSCIWQHIARSNCASGWLRLLLKIKELTKFRTNSVEIGVALANRKVPILGLYRKVFRQGS